MCHWQCQGRVGNVRGDVMVWCRCRRHDLLYRLKSVRGKGKIDDHFWSRLSDVGDGRYCRDDGFPFVVRWSVVLHRLRRVKRWMELCVSSCSECCLYIVPSVCEGVLMNQGIKDTSRAGMRRFGSRKWSGACGTRRCW